MCMTQSKTAQTEKPHNGAETTWLEIVGTEQKTYPSFEGKKDASAKVDIVIIGGGMAGILSAYTLAKTGKKVVVLEKNKIGQGVTAYTTAFITQSLNTDAGELIDIFGQQDAREIAQSHMDAKEIFANIISQEKIDCDFMPCSNYIYASSEKDFEDLKKEYENAKSLGIPVSLVKQGAEEYEDFGFTNFGYLEIQNQAKFHPLKFLFALAQKAIEAGVEIYENTEVLEFSTLPTKHELVKTKQGDIEATYVIVATYNPFDNPKSLYFKKGTYVSYVLELNVHGLRLKEGLFEDTGNPYHYIRIDAESHTEGVQRVIIGGEDHRKDLHVSEEKSFNALLEYSDSLIPAEHRTVTKKWNGPILEPIDGLASIGRIDERNVLYTLGFSGNGMTYSAIAAQVFSDLITGSSEHAAWVRIYNADRKASFKSLMLKGKDYADELMRGALKNTFTQDSDLDPSLPS